jgi:hypothetical protein
MVKDHHHHLNLTCLPLASNIPPTFLCLTGSRLHVIFRCSGRSSVSCISPCSLLERLSYQISSSPMAMVLSLPPTSRPLSSTCSTALYLSAYFTRLLGGLKYYGVHHLNTSSSQQQALLWFLVCFATTCSSY